MTLCLLSHDDDCGPLERFLNMSFLASMGHILKKLVHRTVRLAFDSSPFVGQRWRARPFDLAFEGGMQRWPEA